MTPYNSMVANILDQEDGNQSSTVFARHMAESLDFVLRLDMVRNLEGHRDIVNTLSFNAAGDTLLSGSNDMQIKLWDWDAGHVRVSFDSGHVEDAKFMPFSDDRSIIYHGEDGKVKHAQLQDGAAADPLLFATPNDVIVTRMAIDPSSPHIFYGCSTNASVHRFDVRTSTVNHLLTCCQIPSYRMISGPVRLNAMAIDPRDPNIFAVGGDDEYARLYDLRDVGQLLDCFCSDEDLGLQNTISSLAFSQQSELLVNTWKGEIRLFSKDMGRGPNPMPTTLYPNILSWHAYPVAPDVECGRVAQPAPKTYTDHKNYCTFDNGNNVGFFGPVSGYIVSGSTNGIYIWEKEGGKLARTMRHRHYSIDCIASHPHIPVLASGGTINDIEIWSPHAQEKAALPAGWTHQTTPQTSNAAPEDNFPGRDAGTYDAYII